MHSRSRNHERGAVAIMIAFMWTALFGMAVIAVDFGYLYTKRRGLQAAADSAVVASMPTFKNIGFSQAQARAVAVATASGYTDGTGPTAVSVTQPAVDEFQVSIRRTFPTFFGGAIGIGSKSMTGLAKGKLTSGGGGPAIHANGGGCSAQWAWGVGVLFTGNGKLVVNGDVEAQNKVEVQSEDGSCTAATCKITGAAKSPCAVFNAVPPSDFAIASTAAVGTADPLAANTLATLNAFCTVGNVFAPLGALPWGAEVAGCNPLPAGVYCSNAGINVSAPGLGKSICPSNVSFISAGTVTITGDGPITLNAAAGVPNGIIAFSNFNGGGPAIQLSNGVGLNSYYILNGSIYAPLGEVNVGTGTPGFTMTGMLVGNDVMVAMGPGQPWTFNGPGGGPGPGWTLVQ